MFESIVRLAGLDNRFLEDLEVNVFFESIYTHLFLKS